VAVQATRGPFARGLRTGNGHALRREDRRTAQLLRRTLDCDAVALFTVQLGVASLHLTTWGEDRRPVEDRPPARSLASAIGADLQLLGGAAVRWPGSLAVLPLDRPPVYCQLVVPLDAGLDGRSAWLLGRSGHDFSDEDMEHVTLLAPGLRMRHVGGGSHGTTDALTSRELEVLGLVSRGLTARAVAHRFGISERTVNKHLEHVYRKLDCRDRLSAVLLLRQAGLLGDVG
jgi:DNA-binding CsgD family transcriptional regulator